MMFTFGRVKEVEVAIRRHGGPEKAAMVVDIVSAVHDFIENKADLSDVELTIKAALIEGRRDVWDAAGTWLLKLQKDYPAVEHVWFELVKDPKAEVRYRVASHIIDLPVGAREKIYELLKDDPSKRVREHVEGKWSFAQHPEKYG
ncbi:MAG: hypothetical protein ABWY06_13015 [Pseudomonas sp.]|uniref:hypothetical protein n=1 Tax=Pseudomonas sp. TaxID=306 RepID=UPI003399BF3D